MSKRKTALKGEIAGALRRQSGLTVLFHAAVAERLALGPADHKCLDLLLEAGPLTAGQLADRSGLTTGAITGVIDRLERGGYVARNSDPEDRRRVVVEPKQQGKAMAALVAIFSEIAGGTAEILDRYSQQQLELILDFLQRCETLLQQQTRSLQEKTR